ncbi:MAG: transcription-repair coupling factor [Actinobacteria bacterium]|nr:transcription-repair coupling factor [Actinomycetota bacterium]
MPRLTAFLHDLAPFREALEGGRRGAVHLSSPSFAHAYLLAGFLASPPWNSSACLVAAPTQESAEEVRRELSLFLARPVFFLPARGVWYGPEAEAPPRVVGRRAQALEALRAGGVVVAEAVTLMETVLPGRGRPLALKVGEHADFEGLVERLVDLGYQRVDQVEEAGEFAVRGGLMDIFPTTEPAPVRVEFWGDEVESLRRFSVYSQRSLAALDTVQVPAAAEETGEPARAVTEMLPAGTRVLRVDPARAAVRVAAFQGDLADVFGQNGEQRPGREFYLDWEAVEAALAHFPQVTIAGGAGEGRGEGKVAGAAVTVRATSGDLTATSLPEAERELERMAGDGYRVVVAFESRAEAERAVYILKRVAGRPAGPADVPEAPGITYLAAAHRRHFLLPEIKLALLTDAQIFPRRRKAAGERRLVVGAELSSFRDLRRGDYVVHEDHGIGKFVGLSTKTVAGVTRDYLDIAFRDGDMLYIPHDQIDKVSKYVGADAAPPALSKLGGKAWEQVKNRARRAVRELAGDLLQLYALRRTIEGYAFSEDGEWQRRFEQTFPYEETEDQQRAIDAVKDDMEGPQPMDRLICGDVGYGKTEVALRAAFKAAMDGKQVMVLVPTTILAQQHYGTFRERLTEFPVKVEMISRFRRPREQRRILEDFAAGKVDVLVGTHRLLSQDVAPKDLGLVIVDEEQRFGVAQKEALRNLKLKVDVLTLSATPIPRTLQMSLAGVRDISVIETPPRDRHPIQTYVGVYDEGMVKRAIEREVDRGGQVFYLHNRVETIDRTAARLAELMPRVRFAVAHGQMAEQELERVMLDFLRGDADVLVSTTIIESGLDIPNANTLIVERADLLGLAQLYQIRGRIGRSSRVAHAFLFHPDEAVLTEEAMARLSTLADYTELGSGFKIAMRDLEIRGAGNLLGDEQSGHIAAVGFEMYLAMLQQTVETLQGRASAVERMPRVDVGVSAFVPSSFIAYEAAKVDLHRRIASARTADELAQLREELRDRFGEVPEPVDNLIFLGEVRVALQTLGADSLTARQQKLTITGLHLPKGSRELLRGRDARYAYAPAVGRFDMVYRGEGPGVRAVVERVLGDILGVWSGEAQGAA